MNSDRLAVSACAAYKCSSSCVVGSEFPGPVVSTWGVSKDDSPPTVDAGGK